MEDEAVILRSRRPLGQQPLQGIVVEHVDAVVPKVLREEGRNTHSPDGARQPAEAREDLDEDVPVASGRLR